jgi:FkbM family methyltransferase
MSKSPRLLPQLRAGLKRVKPLRDAVHDLRLLRMYKRFRPDRFALAGSDHTIFVDPEEPRGRALLLGRGAGQPAVKKVWCWALDTLDPDAVIDVGANYGEFLFLPTYSPGARVIGIEANPTLLPYLERSRSTHPNRSQIELHSALAGRASEGCADFYLDRRWSGRSSALLHETIRAPLRTSVPRLAIDSLFAVEERPLRLVFKIDVEGYEPEVFAGMTNMLNATEEAIGILECNEQFLRRLGTSRAAFLRNLRTVGDLHLVRHDATLEPLPSDFDAFHNQEVDDVVVVRG